MKIADVKAAERRYWVATFAAMAPSMLVLIFNMEIAWWLSAVLETVGLVVKAPTIALITLSAAVVLLFVAIFGSQRLFLARCPNCRKPIVPNASGVVIATKNCPNCGGRVIDEASKL